MATGQPRWTIHQGHLPLCMAPRVSEASVILEKMSHISSSAGQGQVEKQGFLVCFHFCCRELRSWAVGINGLVQRGPGLGGAG